MVRDQSEISRYESPTPFPRYLGELEGFELAGARHMGPAAEIDKIALAIERDRFILGDRGDDVGFVFLTHVAKQGHRLIAGHDRAPHREILPGQFLHLSLNGGEILKGERPLKGKIILKPILDHRTDCHLR
jgi:hypothetical protein